MVFVFCGVFVIYLFLHWVFIVVHRLSLVGTSMGYTLVAVPGLLIAVASPVKLGL